MIKSQLQLFPALQAVIANLDTASISAERQLVLQPLIDYVQLKLSNQEPIRLNFICTHNSRRSHLAQVWAQAISCYFGITTVATYSGGTESTALFPMVVKTLTKAGFRVNKLAEGLNPVYSIKYGENALPIIGFSKLLDDDFNPKTNFGAILTCNSADEACPFVPGAEKRIPITYDDPKVYDDSPEQTDKYEERSLQIAVEIKYVFSNIKIS